PAVWWISRQVRVERENCCDDLAIQVCGNPLQYARALTRLEELRAEPPVTVLAANGGSLLARIRRLVVARAEATNGASRWAAGAALVTVLIALLTIPSMPLFAKPDAPKAEPKVAPAPAPQPAPQAKTNCNMESRSEIEVRADGGDSDDDIDIDTDVNVDIDAPEAPEAPEPPDVVVPAIAPRVRVRVPEVDVSEMIAPAIAEAVAPAVAEALRTVRVVTPAVALAAANPVPALAPTPRVRYKRRGETFSSGDKLSVDELIALRSSGITPEYINEMRASSGFPDLSLDELFAMRVQGVTSPYIKSLRDAGLTITSPGEVVGMRVQGVTAEYVKELADAGYRNLSPHDLIGMRVQGVTGAFVKTLADAGYTNLSARELTRLAASGVNADFIHDLAKYRKDKSKAKDK
ncbi:MAG TPA: hypothetical protein VJ032_06730, partial [Thermoanaerobaculia bacterium]|nr:hypothetical protein [Thermoanaerobaculia bacterium]